MDIAMILNHITLDSTSPFPLYIQLANHIAEKIQENLLPAGTKLPPERDLAKQFKVSRTTAINAYRHLEAQGLVEIRAGSGTYICRDTDTLPSHTFSMPWNQLVVPHLKTPISSILRSIIATPDNEKSHTIALAAGLPDPAFYPLQAFEELFQRYSDRLDPATLGYISTEGYQPLRQTLAEICQKKGITAAAENILISSGAQQALYLCSKILLQPGDHVIVETPTYLGAIQIFQSSAAKILSLPYTADGRLDLAMFEDYLIRYRPKLFYTIPTHQNPSGRVMPLAERQQLLELAARHRLIIIEDDPYSELSYDRVPPPSLKALDPYGGVLYLGTCSKVLLPGLRTGWVVGPQIIINRLAQEKQYDDLHTNTLTQWLLHLYLQEGRLAHHLDRVRPEYKKRRNVLADSLKHFCGDAITFSIPDGGFHLWCTLKKQITSHTLLHEASKAGLSFVPGEAFYVDQSGYDKLRLCFASHDTDDLHEAARRLGKLLHSLPPGSPKHKFIPAFYTGRPII